MQWVHEGRPFYVHRATNTRTWKRPAPEAPAEASDAVSRTPPRGSAPARPLGPDTESAPELVQHLTVESLFDIIDVDGSGDVSFDEFVRWWEENQHPADDGRKLEAALRVFTNLNVDGSGLLDRFDFKAVLEMLQDRQWVPATDPAGRQIFTNSATGESRRDRPSMEEGLAAWLADTFGAREEPLHVTRSDRV